MIIQRIDDIEPVTAHDYAAEQEIAAAAGLFAPLPGCDVERIVRTCDGQEEYALLRFHATAGQDLLSRWSRSRRIAVSARCGSHKRYLFCGVPSLSQWQLGNAVSPNEVVQLRVEGIASALRRCPDLVVTGRFARTLRQWDSLATCDTAASLSGLPCSFSPRGLSNCAAQPIRVRLCNNTVHTIPIFTHDEDPDARPWTIARVLRYLAWFHLRTYAYLDVEPLLTATQTAAEQDSDGRDPYRQLMPLQWALRGAVTSFSVEGTSAIDAFAQLLLAAHLHWHIEHAVRGDTFGSQLQIWSDRQGPVRSFRAADSQPGEVPAHGDARTGEILSCTLRRNLTASVQQAIALGDVKYHEVTVELSPGWPVLAELDALPYAQRAAAKAVALLDDDIKTLGPDAVSHPWYQKFHRKGSLFALYQDAGRLWVLNEHGRYMPEIYNRYAPFHDYQPFRFSRVLSQQAADADHWMIRPRRLLAPITRSSSGAPLPIFVEISFDAGATWSTCTAPLRVMNRECAIMLDADNLCTIAPPGTAPSQQNLWYALIDQKVRIRVTAVIQGDECVHATAASHIAAPGSPGQVIQAMHDLPYRSAAGAVNVLRDARLEGSDIDSSIAAATMAQAAIDDHQGFSFEATLPGLRLDAALGQRVFGLSRLGTQLFEGPLTTSLPTVRHIEYVAGHQQRTRIIAE